MSNLHARTRPSPPWLPVRGGRSAALARRLLHPPPVRHRGEVGEHTAGEGVRAWGPDLPGLFTAAARVTWHELVVEDTAEGLEARILFDV